MTPADPPAGPEPARRGFAVLVLALLSAGFLAHVASWDFVSDDAFISLRYARNLLDGHGLVFNPGERVEGFTGLLWVGMVALAGLLGADLLAAARVMGAAFGVATLWLSWRLAERLRPAGVHPLASLAAPALVAANGAFACWAAAGLETSLWVFTASAAVLAALAGRHGLSSGLAALTVLVRPEGALVVLVLGLERAWAAWRARRPAVLGWWIAPVATIVALTAFRLAYYGDLVPNTFHAKAGGGPAQWVRGGRYLAAYLSDRDGLAVAAGLLVFGLARGGAWRLASAVVATLWAGVVWVGGDGLPMYRFAVTPLPAWVALQAAVGGRLAAALAGDAPSAGRRAASALVPLAALAGIALAVSSQPRIPPHFENARFQRDVEVPRWTRVGQRLRAEAPPGASLAAVPIGAVAYHSGLPAIDMVGLTDRHIARRDMPDMGAGWAGHEKHDGPYVLSRRPTFLLLGNIDVTPAPRDPAAVPFIPYTNRAIFAREADVVADPDFARLYRPRSIQLAEDQWLNLYELKPEHRVGPGSTP